MTFSPLPADLTALLGHLDNAAVAGHAAAAVRLLAERGVDLPPILLDEIEEVETECRFRDLAARRREPANTNAPLAQPETA